MQRRTKTGRQQRFLESNKLIFWNGIFFQQKIPNSFPSLLTAGNIMNPIMAIFHRYFTQRHLHPGMKEDTNLAGRTEKDFVILCVWEKVCVCQECGCMNLTEIHIRQQPDAAWQSFQVFKSYTPPATTQSLQGLEKFNHTKHMCKVRWCTTK